MVLSLVFTQEKADGGHSNTRITLIHLETKVFYLRNSILLFNTNSRHTLV